MLIALSQEAYTRFRPEAKGDALVLIDEGLVSPTPEDKVLRIPTISIAEKLGRRIVANMVMLGFVASHLELIDRQAMEKSIKTSVRENTIPLNLRAFKQGFEYAPIKETLV